MVQRHRRPAATRATAVSGEQFRRRFAEIVAFGQGAAQRSDAAVRCRHRLLAVAAEGGEHIVHVFRTILRENAEGVARFVHESGSLERKFHMVHLLPRAGTIQVARRQHQGRKRVLLGIEGGRFLIARRRSRDGGGKGSGAGVQRGESGVEPAGERLLIVEIAIDPWHNAVGAKFFETGIEILSALAEVRVVGVAQRTDGKA